MLTAFEQQLVSTLRAKLPADIRAHVTRATGARLQKGIVVGISNAEPMPANFSSTRPEITAGANTPRRMVRLRCTVDCRFIAINNSQDRSALLLWLDQVLYLLDDADIRSGSAFNNAVEDSGFNILSMSLQQLDTSFNIFTRTLPLQISFTVDGWFWPIGSTGQAGVEIGEVRIRGAVLPVVLSPAQPELIANGDAVDLKISFATQGRSRINALGLSSEAFGRVSAIIEQEDGTAGAGSLSGGSVNADGLQLFEVINEQIQITYTPAALANTDILRLRLDDESTGGIEIAHFSLITGAA